MADIDDIRHLLRRTEYIARPARVAQLTPLTLEQAVDDVLDFTKNTPVELPANLTVYDHDNRFTQRTQMHDWWLDLMARQARPFQEKMAFFWHGHFVSEWTNIERTDYMMRQIDLYRRQALGDFRELAQAMSIEPMMLRYLSGASNVRGRPNENFGRELLELFLLGVGNYTQSDVAECSRAWTGYNLVNHQFAFRPTQHDTGSKTIFGVTRPWKGPEVIDFIVSEDRVKQMVCAKLITRKLWESLAYADPSNALVQQLAEEFVRSGMQLRALARAILLHPQFYSTASKQGMLRSPVEWVVAILAATGVPATGSGAFGNLVNMGQRPLDPPNVAGWKHNAYFLGLSAVGARAAFARGVVAAIVARGAFTGITTTTTASQAVDVVASFFGITPSQQTRDAMVSTYTRDRAANANAAAVSNLVVMALLSGEMNAPS